MEIGMFKVLGLLILLIALTRCTQVIRFSKEHNVTNGTSASNELTGAVLDIANVPPTFTICSAFMVEQWGCFFGCDSISIFQLFWKDGTSMLIKVVLEERRMTSKLVFRIGNSTWDDSKIVVFLQQWVHICLSINSSLDSVQVVVDGQYLDHDRPKGLWRGKKSSDLRVSLGYDKNENKNVTITEVNIFSTSNTEKRMRELTTPSSNICGSQGDLLNWRSTMARWKLASVAKFSEIDADSTPCSDNFVGVAVLRGLCHKSRQDLMFMPKFKWMGNHLRVWWVGSISSELRFIWTPHPGYWQLQNGNFTAKSTINYESHAFGRHTWMIDKDVCNGGKGGYETDLKLTFCSEEEFTCRDGACVGMDQRCDRIPNCRDESDETDCHTVIFDHGYRKDISPIHPILDLRDVKASLFPSRSKVNTTQIVMNKAIVPLKVRVDISKVKVVSMDMEEAQHYITFQFKIALSWRDQRLTFHNLKHDESLNALNSNETDHVWLPLLIYDNTDDKDTTRLGLEWEQWFTLIEVQREGNFTRSGYDQVDEAEVFAGSENTLRMKQIYKRKFQCQYMLSQYPFDSQVRDGCQKRVRFLVS